MIYLKYQIYMICYIKERTITIKTTSLTNVLEIIEIYSKKIDAKKHFVMLFNFEKIDNDKFHIEIDNDVFKLQYSERGSIENRIICEDLDDLIYAIFEIVTSNMATEYANKFSINFRKTRFKHQLKLLKKLDKSFYLKRKTEIDEILIKHPYR